MKPKPKTTMKTKTNARNHIDTALELLANNGDMIDINTAIKNAEDANKDDPNDKVAELKDTAKITRTYKK